MLSGKISPGQRSFLRISQGRRSWVFAPLDLELGGNLLGLSRSSRIAGHDHDSSIFHAVGGHGGIPDAILESHFIETPAGSLFEMPLSIIKMFCWRTSVFGGCYLRLAPTPLIKWGIRKLEAAQRPLIVYVHPREIDPNHPRLPLPLLRRFKCYVNLKSTLPKLEWLCRNCSFCTMREMANSLKKAN